MADQAKQEGRLSEAALNNIKSWQGEAYKLAHSDINQQLEEAAEASEDQKQAKWDAIKDAWFTDVAIGTAGMRGVRGWGTNRINLFTMGKLQIAHAKMIQSVRYTELIQRSDSEFDSAKEKKAIVIGGDSREGNFEPKNKPEQNVTQYQIEVEQLGWQIKLNAMLNIAFGTRAYVYRLPVSTPQVSWSTHVLDVDAVDHQGYRVVSGAMNTASHNPPEHNGNKPYQIHGAQGAGDFSAYLGEGISLFDMNELAGLQYQGLNILEKLDEVFERAIRKGDAVWIGGDGLTRADGTTVQDPYQADEKFIDAELPEAIHVVDKLFNSKFIDLKTAKIVISPLWGVTRHILEKILKIRGVPGENIIWVESSPNPKFTGHKTPNPETGDARLPALQAAIENNADLAEWADPDADRPAVAAKKNPSLKSAKLEDYLVLNGNQQLAVLMDYMIREVNALETSGEVQESGSAMSRLAKSISPAWNKVWMASTVVSGDLAKQVAKKNGLNVIETLTGFKYIGDQIQKHAHLIQKAAGLTERQWIKLSKEKQMELGLQHLDVFIKGGEESYGALTGQGAHDKDAISGLMWFIEIFGRLRKEGITLEARLNEIYEKYGYFSEEMANQGQKPYAARGIELSESQVFELIGKKDKATGKRPEGATLLGHFLTNTPQVISGKKVVSVLNYENQEARDAKGNLLFDSNSASGYFTLANGIQVYSFAHAPVGNASAEKLPKEDFIALVLEDGAKIVARPSGTEPIIKFYILGRGKLSEKDQVNAWLKQVKTEIDTIADEIARARYPRSEVRTEKSVPEFLAVGDQVVVDQTLSFKVKKVNARGKNTSVVLTFAADRPVRLVTESGASNSIQLELGTQTVTLPANSAFWVDGNPDAAIGVLPVNQWKSGKSPAAAAFTFSHYQEIRSEVRAQLMFEKSWLEGQAAQDLWSQLPSVLESAGLRAGDLAFHAASYLDNTVISHALRALAQDQMDIYAQARTSLNELAEQVRQLFKADVTTPIDLGVMINSMAVDSRAKSEMIRLFNLSLRDFRSEVREGLISSGPHLGGVTEPSTLYDSVLQAHLSAVVSPAKNHPVQQAVAEGATVSLGTASDGKKYSLKVTKIDSSGFPVIYFQILNDAQQLADSPKVVFAGAPIQFGALTLARFGQIHTAGEKSQVDIITDRSELRNRRQDGYEPLGSQHHDVTRGDLAAHAQRAGAREVNATSTGRVEIVSRDGKTHRFPGSVDANRFLNKQRRSEVRDTGLFSPGPHLAGVTESPILHDLALPGHRSTADSPAGDHQVHQAVVGGETLPLGAAEKVGAPQVDDRTGRSEVRVNRITSVAADLFAGIQIPLPANQMKIRAGIVKATNLKIQQGLIFSAEFAFDRGGLLLIPSITGGLPGVVVVQNAKQKELVADLNVQLKLAGWDELRIAQNGFEAMEFLNEGLVDYELRTGNKLGKGALVLDYGTLRQELLGARRLSQRDIQIVTDRLFQSMIRQSQTSVSSVSDFVLKLEAMGAVSSAA